MRNAARTIKNSLENLPKTAGVYFLRDKSKIIYIGKAANIKERVKNHFSQPSYRDRFFIGRASKVDFIKTDSEIEALILEAGLIKKHQPKFNVSWRDDKNYFYVAIAKNKKDLPHVYITHQPYKKSKKQKAPARNAFGIANAGGKSKNELGSNPPGSSPAGVHENLELKIKYVGPFVEGSALKKTLKYLRRVFPYYTFPNHPKQKCPWCHLDLCPGPNPDIKAYKRNVRKLTLILRGKRKNVLRLLKKEMKTFSNSQEFENAAKVRNQIYALEKVISHAKVIAMPDLAMVEDDERQADDALPRKADWQKVQATLKALLSATRPISRIECYDVSNIQGKFATGSMVVFTNGKPNKSGYKRFRIKMKQEPNDTAMLGEVLKRRFKHPEWGRPEVILVDGGRAQLNVAINSKSQIPNYKQIRNRKLKLQNIKSISIAKGKQELFIEGRREPIPLENLSRETRNLIKHLDDEAHRFAISYHKKLRAKSLTFDKSK